MKGEKGFGIYYTNPKISSFRIIPFFFKHSYIVQKFEFKLKIKDVGSHHTMLKYAFHAEIIDLIAFSSKQDRNFLFFYANLYNTDVQANKITDICREHP